VVETLEDAHRQAQAERALVAGWSDEQVQVLREGLRQPRFADEAGLAAELAQASAELAAVRALRDHLAG
jgi:hypothetical protein